MTLAFYDPTRTAEASQSREPVHVLGDMGEHEKTYRDFVFFARCAAFAVPLFMAFVLYWTT
jgi:hypothetical protein